MIKFRARGHKNILGTQQSTLEFTKDADLTLQGDCIIGVESDFKLDELREFIKHHGSFVMKLKVGEFEDSVSGQTNPEFSDDKELVVRLTDFRSPRTFGVSADKSSQMLSRDLIEAMKSPDAMMEVTIE